jgi:hypothetical protein
MTKKINKMKKQICYEWCYEIVDEHNDIIDSHFAERLDDLRLGIRDEVEENQRIDLCLVRYEYTNNMETDRHWAYVKDGILSDTFNDAYENPIHKVPLKFKKERVSHYSFVN